MKNFFILINRWSIYLLVFLLPIFFLPFTLDSRETSKQFLLIFLVTIIFVSWLGVMFIEKTASLRCGTATWLQLLFLVGIFLSALFSLSKYQSWIGQGGQEYVSLLTMATFFLLFFVLANRVWNTSFFQKIFSLLVSSTFLGAIAVWANVLGWLNFLPIFSTPGTNSVGTITTFVIFLITTSVFSIGAWLVQKSDGPGLLPKGSLRFLLLGLIIFLLITTTFFLISLKVVAIWLLFILGLGLLLLFSLITVPDLNHRRVFAVFVILLINIFLFFGPISWKFDFPVVVSPSLVTSFSVVKQTWSENIERLVFGSGPGTFDLDYNKYKPTAVNETIFWNTTFDRAKSHVLTMAATFGVFGLSLWTLMILFITIKGGVFLFRKNQLGYKEIVFPLFAIWLILILAQIFYSSNLTLQFCFWLIAGLLVGQITKAKEIIWANGSRKGLVVSFLFAVISVGSAAVLLLAGQYYFSEVKFAQAIELDKNKAPQNQVVNQLLSVVSINSFSDIYYRNLSQALLLETDQVYGGVILDGSTPDANEIANLQQLLKLTLAASDRAVVLSLNNANNWLQRGNVYWQVNNLVAGAEKVASESFSRAMVLEPSNPLPLIQLGKLNIGLYDRQNAAGTADQAVDNLTAAEKYLTQAITLKQDYAPAHYYLAAVFERQGKLEEAVARLVALRTYRPSDIGLGFQLAMLYIRLEKFDLAQAELERIINLSPDYANARWYLAALYEKNSQFDKAIEQVNKVAELNHENQEVKNKLEQLRAGQAAAVIPEPVEEVGVSIETRQ